MEWLSSKLATVLIHALEHIKWLAEALFRAHFNAILGRETQIFLLVKILFLMQKIDEI